MRLTLIGISAALLAACNPPAAQDQPAANSSASAPAIVNPAVSESAGNAEASQRKAPLAEPQGAIDPGSVEAAGQVVQHYGALVEKRHWLKAERLWSDLGAARAFATALSREIPVAHLEIGELGATEGAAGSVYTTVPVTFYGQTARGDSARHKADVILRRVNDVTGSTGAQRRWHIERIEWAA